jgi:flagellar hook-associated protein 1 FlgK
MSLNSIMSTAMSGLSAAQTALTTTSDNIANVNTPGYTRKVVDLSSVVAGGSGAGVTVQDIRRVTDKYLQAASLQAQASAGSASVISDLLDQAQASFGDPTSASSYLNQLNTVFSDFASAANDPASNLPRAQALDNITTFLDTSQQVAGTLAGLNTQADTRIGSDVDQINQLLSQINGLNTEITRTIADGADATGSQDAQSQLLDKLSSLISVSVTSQPNGSVSVRSATGVLLADDSGAASLAYAPSSTGVGSIQISHPGQPLSAALDVGDGELAGLLSLRNSQIPAIQQQLAEYVSGSIAAINGAHNANTTVPPPQSLTGRNTGLDLPTIVGDFSGKTTIAIVGANSQLATRVDVDFTAGTMSVNGGPASAFTPANFLASLSTALGASGSATFANGALTLSATAAGAGVAITDDAATPARDGGQGFSQFLGLNDLITASQITNYNTGLKATDPSGFTAGGQITLQITDQTGTPVRDVTVTVPAAASLQTLINTLNAPVGGVGQFGTFSLDANGALSFAPTTPGAASVAVLTDNTQRGAGGPSISQLFGLGAAQRASRASTFQIRLDIAANPMNLALAKLDLTQPAGQPVVAIGDPSGALALSQVANSTTTFAAAGDLPAMTTSATLYASQLGGDLGRKAATATDANTAAKSVQDEATKRRQSVEGVNLDEELVNLTTFQQSYSASARLIQAAKDMMNTLLNMVP